MSLVAHNFYHNISSLELPSQPQILAFVSRTSMTYELVVLLWDHVFANHSFIYFFVAHGEILSQQI
jgi:hypothetical protein